MLQHEFRVHANNEAGRLQNINSKIVTNHYMDLQFYVSMFYYYTIMNNVCYLCLAGLLFFFRRWARLILCWLRKRKNSSAKHVHVGLIWTVMPHIVDLLGFFSLIKDDVPFKRYVKSILRLEQDYRLDMDVQGFG